jgi:hypothetical protein
MAGPTHLPTDNNPPDNISDYNYILQGYNLWLFEHLSGVGPYIGTGLTPAKLPRSSLSEAPLSQGKINLKSLKNIKGRR